MHSKDFLDNINAKLYGKKLYLFDELESTNKYAISEIENKAIEEGTCYLSLRQISGIGTSGSAWESSKPMGMWLSIVLNSPIIKEPLSFVPAIAMARMLKECCDIEAHLKWPNDVLIGSKKISGILVQAKIFSVDRASFVLGIGLNISQTTDDFSDDIKSLATSIKIESGKEHKLEDIYKSYMKHFEEVYTANDIDIVEEWLKYSKMIDKTITIIKDEATTKAKVLSITKEGYLEIEYLDNKKVEVIEARAGIKIDANY